MALLDIVVLVHDRSEWADLCIRSVESFTQNPYHLYLVDMASVEAKTKTMLKLAESRGHTVLRLAENRSFSHGVNAGVRLGKSDFVVVLNDDAIVTEGWDSALIQDATPKPIGLVGARTNYAAGAMGDPNSFGEPPWLVFVCVCLRREVWDALGPMDEATFDGFSSEDIDYSWHARRSGLKLKVSSAYVLHAGSRTLASKLDAAAQHRNNEKYNARLLDKWGKKWVEEHTQSRGRVLVATFHAEEWTRVDFMGALLGLKRADGVAFSYYHHRRTMIAAARQIVADYATDQGFEWLVQLDDDAVFPSDLLRRLLVHDKDVVCALAYGRKPPHKTCVYQWSETLNPDGTRGGNHMEGIEHTGLRRVDASGFHCSLMRTKVIKELRAFRSDRYPEGIRRYYGGFDNRMGEDFAFCTHLAELGIPLHVDTELISGHIGDSVLIDEGYKRAFDAGQSIVPPALTSPDAANELAAWRTRSR